MVKKGNMLDVSDVSEILAVKLLGVVPEDEEVVVSTNKGEPLSLGHNSPAARAFRNICHRLLGKDIPLQYPNENEGKGFWEGIKSLFRL
jgi:septum site-determining protein MinD